VDAEHRGRGPARERARAAGERLGTARDQGGQEARDPGRAQRLRGALEVVTYQAGAVEVDTGEAVDLEV
jgi:hypothetical protein